MSAANRAPARGVPPPSGLVDWCRAALPAETCGLLLGRWVAGAPRLERVTLAANRLAAGERERGFELDPLHLLHEQRRADREAQVLLGVWHSHPTAGPEPSRADLECAWPTSLAWILGPIAAPEAVRARLWIRTELAFVPLTWANEDWSAIEFAASPA